MFLRKQNITQKSEGLTTDDKFPGVHQSLSALMLGAIGVVYRDIGTSPLYTMKTIFSGPLSINDETVLGILSAVFWSLFIIVTVKYVMVIMRTDNRGQGGVLSLSTLASRGITGKWIGFVTVLGMLGLVWHYFTVTA